MSGSSRYRSLFRYLGVRALLVVPTVWFLITLVFFLVRLSGDPITAALGGRASVDEIARRKHEAGYDKPLYEQYWEFLKKLVTGDFGLTSTDRQPVKDVLLHYAPATFELAAWAMLIAVAIGVPAGRFAVARRDRLPDVVSRFGAILVYAAPVFFVAILLKLVFSVWLGWLPNGGRSSTLVELELADYHPRTGIMILDVALAGDGSAVVDVLKHAVLPALALGLMTAGIVFRLVRANLIQTSQAGYVEAAKARGLSNRRVFGRHAFRNALIPVVTVMGMQTAAMLGGAVLTENAFDWKGLGYALADYLVKRDFEAVQGIVVFAVVVIAVFSVLVDAVTAIIDPRVRF
ncbi:MAG: ABC transporter permease [Segniliparus sp.]|uniref:ABC transporter permease n=1 Tax=Segniliparus sp. TaxID=2804064 RepID=UPI003F377352